MSAQNQANLAKLKFRQVNWRKNRINSAIIRWINAEMMVQELN